MEWKIRIETERALCVHKQNQHTINAQSLEKNGETIESEKRPAQSDGEKNMLT